MQTLLVVDDDEDIVDIISMSFEDQFEVVTAQNGFDAIKLFEEKKPALIITDLIMPNFNGLDFIRSIRSADPDIPIVATSGHSAKLLARAEKFGASVGLSKPFEVTQLVNLVRGLVEKS